MGYIFPDHPVLIYDGACNLCNASVDFVLRHDRAARIWFTASQSESGMSLLKQFPEAARAGETILLFDSREIFAQSDAVLRILRYLPFPWRVLGSMHWFPRPARDWVYGFISKNRHKWFGEQIACRMSLKGFEDRFLP